MKTVATLLVCLVLTATSAFAQAAARLRIVVKDPSGAVIPNAVVHIASADGGGGRPIAPVSTDGEGVAASGDLPPGRYAITVEFPGFETRTLTEVRLRGGENRREVVLPIEKVAESVAVGRDAATAASDPRSDRFSNALSRDQIDVLPDDPDEMEKVLKEMAGPGAVMRVDGF